MRPKLIAALMIAAAISGTAHAQSDPVGVCKDSRGCTDSGGGNSTDSYPTIFGTRPLIDDLTDLFGGQEKRQDAGPSPQQQARQQRRREALAANNRGVAFQNDGAWAQAVAAYQEAVEKDPSDPVMRDNLVRARAGLANARGLAAYNKGDYAGAVALFQEADSTDPKQDIFRQNLAAAQAALANAQAQVESQRRDKATAQHMQKAIQGFAQTLNAAPAAGGLDFDGGNSGTPASAAGNAGGLDFATTVVAADPVPPPPKSGCATPGSTMTVDACNVPSGLPKAVEDAISGAYRNAPPGVIERVRKGFQAVASHDWNVAKASFEDALNHDPGNAGLKHMIVLADYSLDSRAEPPAAAASPPPAPSASPKPAEIDKFFRDFREGRKQTPTDQVRSYVQGLSNEEFKRLVWDMKPIDSDMEYLFDLNTPPSPKSQSSAR